MHRNENSYSDSSNSGQTPLPHRQHTASPFPKKIRSLRSVLHYTYSYSVPFHRGKAVQHSAVSLTALSSSPLTK
ncbi:hypothetical protein Plhal304r1_c044g0125241 [Plasmopara halstedii]